MIVCDNCRTETCSPVTMHLVKKSNATKKLIEVSFDVCEKCLTTLLQNVGRLKKEGHFFKMPPVPANGVANVMNEIKAQATANTPA